MEEPKQPWEKINWSQEQVQIIYRDWGNFYSHKQQLDIAALYYDKSLDMVPDDSLVLYFRSRCKRDIAQTMSALHDAKAAAELDPLNSPINLEICDGIYELNQFENAKIELHENTRRFHGNKVRAFLHRLDVVNENFKDVLGESLGPFILRNQKHFPTVLRDYHREQFVDTRPLWKILKELGKCDVLSILEVEEVLLSPRELARRERSFRVFNQNYMNKSWIDVLFLKNLRKNPDLMIPQSRVSTPQFQYLINSKYAVVKNFIKMLQSRSPWYNEIARKCKDRDICARHMEDFLLRLQYHTRRRMNTILRNIGTLRKAGKIEKLSRFIEEEMGDFTVIKIHRIMPWKLEFMYDVYYTLALAHIDRCKVIDVKNFEPNEQLMALLRLPTQNRKDRPISFVFGDKSTYQEPDAVDNSMIAFKKFQARLEHRMVFAKVGIERCYLHHEMARAFLKQYRFDECCSAALKGIEEAKHCNSLLWQFLCYLLIVKSHAILCKVERAKDVLEHTMFIALMLKDTELIKFIEACSNANDQMILLKKKISSKESISLRKVTSKHSMASTRRSEVASQESFNS